MSSNPFSPNYVRQIKPGPRIPFKLPKLNQPPRHGSLVDNSAANEPDYVRRHRISKTRI